MGFELRFTNKENNAWGSMGLMKRMLNRVGFNLAVVASELLQHRGAIEAMRRPN